MSGKTKPGRPADRIVEDHFTRVAAVQNQSKRHFFACKHCDVIPMEGRDQRPAIHLTKCVGATPEIRQEAHLHLVRKGFASVQTGPLLGPGSTPSTQVTPAVDSGPTILTLSLSQTANTAVVTKKRKANNLDNYVDHPLPESLKELADIKLFRFVVHSNSAFRISENPYLKEWINTLRPSYEIPSRYVLSNRLMQAEVSRVKLEEIARVQAQTRQTILFDGWEDKMRRSLYGTVSAGMGEFPTVLALTDMSGNRGSADNYVTTVKDALANMEIADAKNMIALTTDNPTVMRSFRTKFQLSYPWILTFTCFLHLLNTAIGKIVVFPEMKIYISGMATVVSFFNSSHYWGGQLAIEAKALKVGRSLKSRTESRWYSLILQALSVIAHRASLLRICSRDDAQRRTNGNTPVSAAVIKWVMDITFWDRLEQLVRVCKPLVDAVGTAHPLTTLAITLFSVVPHSANVERLFSGLSGIQGVKRCNLSVPTFEALGKLRNNYAFHLHQSRVAQGLPVRRQHAHMHTRTHPGIDTSLADELETNFTWQPPLVVEEVENDVGVDTSDSWADGEMEKELAEWEKRLEDEARVPLFPNPVPSPTEVYDFAELVRIDAGVANTHFDKDHSIHIDDDSDEEAGGPVDIEKLLAARGILS
ncbi:unnamed protein product [Mycena citricolor]|uniref:DUF659 domain-containing protein n=1 Tax=Mycena citricolor TaxID=2018698 RepID=A0AAD2Q707_9AGAR|nr:unnamed protein product [Mycena citricolor]CAK5283388.1 unnamed protein product [Mycena citricolor]